MEFQVGGIKWRNDKKNNKTAGHNTTIEEGMQNLEKGGNAKSRQNKRFDRQGEWKTKARVLKRKWDKHMQAKWGDLLNSRGILIYVPAVIGRLATMWLAIHRASPSSTIWVPKYSHLPKSTGIFSPRCIHERRREYSSRRNSSWTKYQLSRNTQNVHGR